MLQDNVEAIDAFMVETNIAQMRHITMDELKIWTAQEAVHKNIEHLETLKEVIGVRRVLAERIGTRTDGCILLFLICIRLGVEPTRLMFAPLNMEEGQTAVILYKMSDSKTVAIDWTNIRCVATHPNFKVEVKV
jgi:hypothetical protein